MITRENLYNLPYSVDEIYGIHSSGKYQNTKRTYQQFYQIYAKEESVPIEPELIIVEDSNAGYEFFKNICHSNSIYCTSAEGKAKLLSIVKQNRKKEVCVIADGAAIGP